MIILLCFDCWLDMGRPAVWVRLKTWADDLRQCGRCHCATRDGYFASVKSRAELFNVFREAS
jgi:hypothetical protein